MRTRVHTPTRERDRIGTRSRLAPLCAAALLAAWFLATATTAAHAQVPTLDRVDTLLAAGDYDAARSTLERWWSARDEFEIPGSDKARGLMLRAQLAPTPDEAEPDYLAIVLGYPTSSHAPEALLRLGQGLLATGDAARAAAYLERLAADYPGRADRDVGLLWLARAHNAARRPAAACRAAREGLQATRDPDLSAMLRVEEGSSCAIASRQQPPGAAGEPGATGTQAPTPRPAQPEQGRAELQPAEPQPAGTDRPDPQPAQPAATGDWAVQTGAFRYRRSADSLLERLREAGYQPRLVLVPRNDLLRVRLGRYASAEEAARVVERLRAQGFEAVPVNDAARERQP